jgi:hypothetical protein
MIGNRGIYHKGWTAVTKHRTPWEIGAIKTVPFDDDIWELYDTNADWTQAHDLAKEMPDKLHELQRLWLIEAVKYNVVPLDDRLAERFNPDLAGRPQLVRGNRQMLFGGMKGLSPHSVVSIYNKSWPSRPKWWCPRQGRKGHLANGGITGGVSLYAKGWQAEVLLQLLGIQSLLHREHTADPGRQAPGAHGVRL